MPRAVQITSGCSAQHLHASTRCTLRVQAAGRAASVAERSAASVSARSGVHPSTRICNKRGSFGAQLPGYG